MRSLRQIYERLKSKNPTISDDQLRRAAWVQRDRMIFY
jgi:hypothetical protein